MLWGGYVLEGALLPQDFPLESFLLPDVSYLPKCAIALKPLKAMQPISWEESLWPTAQEPVMRGQWMLRELSQQPRGSQFQASAVRSFRWF